MTVSTKTDGLYRLCGGAELPVRSFAFASWWRNQHSRLSVTAFWWRTTEPKSMWSHEDTASEGQDSAASSPRSIKGSLSFILDDQASVKRSAELEVAGLTPVKRLRPSESATSISSLLAPITDARNATRAAAPLERKSSKYCIVEGCGSRAKHARRCWKHGGSVKCKVAGCRNRAKTKGVCWSHGGGTICSADQCTTIAVSNGVCWAHGGGKRCVTPGCSRPAYERTNNMCSMHYNAGVSSLK